MTRSRSALSPWDHPQNVCFHSNQYYVNFVVFLSPFPFRNGWFSSNSHPEPYGNNSPQGHRVTPGQPPAVPPPGQPPVPEVLTVTVTVEAQNHRMARVGRDLQDHKSPAPPPQARPQTISYQPRLPRAPSSLALNTSRDGRGIHSLSGSCSSTSPLSLRRTSP